MFASEFLESRGQLIGTVYLGAPPLHESSSPARGMFGKIVVPKSSSVLQNVVEWTCVKQSNALDDVFIYLAEHATLVNVAANGRECP